VLDERNSGLICQPTGIEIKLQVNVTSLAPLRSPTVAHNPVWFWCLPVEADQLHAMVNKNITHRTTCISRHHSTGIEIPLLRNNANGDWALLHSIGQLCQILVIATSTIAWRCGKLVAVKLSKHTLKGLSCSVDCLLLCSTAIGGCSGFHHALNIWPVPFIGDSRNTHHIVISIHRFATSTAIVRSCAACDLLWRQRDTIGHALAEDEMGFDGLSGTESPA